MEFKRIRPSKRGDTVLHVPYPPSNMGIPNNRILPKSGPKYTNGVIVPWDRYWRRLLKDGDVELVEDSEDNKEQSEPEATEPEESETIEDEEVE